MTVLIFGFAVVHFRYFIVRPYCAESRTALTQTVFFQGSKFVAERAKFMKCTNRKSTKHQ